MHNAEITTGFPPSVAAYITDLSVREAVDALLMKFEDHDMPDFGNIGDDGELSRIQAYNRAMFAAAQTKFELVDSLVNLFKDVWLPPSLNANFDFEREINSSPNQIFESWAVGAYTTHPSKHQVWLGIEEHPKIKKDAIWLQVYRFEDDDETVFTLPKMSVESTFWQSNIDADGIERLVTQPILVEHFQSAPGHKLTELQQAAQQLLSNLI